MTKNHRTTVPERELVEDICNRIEEINPRCAELTPVFQKSPSTRMYDRLTAFHTFSLDAEFRAAVERIENGSYGRCTVCGRTIAPGELHAVPLLRYCSRCRSGMSQKSGSRMTGSGSSHPR